MSSLTRKIARSGPLLAAVLVAACDSADVESRPGGADGGAAEPLVTRLADVAGSDAAQPHLARSSDGTVIMNWQRPSDAGYVLEFARLTGRQWSEPERVAEGENWFINWADFPSVVPIAGDIWMAHWLEGIPDSFAYNAMISVSMDAGRSWRTPILLNDDGTETEHGFVTLFPWDAGMGAVWLDGRRLDEWTFEKELAAEIPLGVSLYFARLDASGGMLERGEIDELVCDCCQPDVALASGGPVLVYRDRTPEEVRDIVARRYRDGAWSQAVAVGDDNFEIDGCPVNGPTVAARGDAVVAAWFTAPGNQPAVRFARSDDAGASFAPAIDLDAVGSFGQTDVVLLDDSAAIVSWWRRHPEGGLALVLQRVEADGTLGPKRTVAHSDVSQPLDVPQMVQADDGLVLVWTGIDAQAGIHAIHVSGL